MSDALAAKRADLLKAKEKLAMFLDAEDRIVIGGQTMMIDDGDMKRMVTRADVKWISQRIDFYRGEISRLESEIAAGGRPRRRGIYVRLM